MEFFLLLLFLLGSGGSSPGTPPPFPAPQPIPPNPIPSPVPAQPPATAPAPQQQQPPASSATYVIKDGDTPFGIARRFTGDGARHKELLPVNPSLKVVNTRDDDGVIVATHYVPFNAGQVLNLPASWPATPQQA